MWSRGAPTGSDKRAQCQMLPAGAFACCSSRGQHSVRTSAPAPCRQCLCFELKFLKVAGEPPMEPCSPGTWEHSPIPRFSKDQVLHWLSRWQVPAAHPGPHGGQAAVGGGAGLQRRRPRAAGAPLKARDRGAQVDTAWSVSGAYADHYLTAGS